jgi:hypothetical protein
MHRHLQSQAIISCLLILARTDWGRLQDNGQEEEEREVAEVEMLLGAYYMNLDSVWNKLADISEFVDDAEVGLLSFVKESLLHTACCITIDQ